MTEKINQGAVKHGAVIFPKTMAMVCEDLGLIERWQTNEFEGGKNYPETEAGGKFPGFPDDVISSTPPADGHILSGGKTDARDCVNFTNEEMREKTGIADFDWRNHAIKIKVGEKFTVKWSYHTEHKTRGYDWWLTKNPVDFSKRLTREDFVQPFDKQYSEDTPHWAHTLPVSHVTETTIQNVLPGIYVLLGRWIIADSPMAFHQPWIVEIEDSSTEIIGAVGTYEGNN